MSIQCILMEQKTSSSGSTVILKSIEVITPPNKTMYLSGDTFDPTGIEILASYGIENFSTILATSPVPISACAISPNVLNDDTQYVTISYTQSGITVSTQIEITVNPALKELSITPPTKVSYSWGDNFQTSGLVVTAKYTDNSIVNITEYTMKIGEVTISNGTALNNSNFIIGNNVVDITYIENERSAQATFSINIAKKQLTIPSQSGSLTYNGSMQSPTLTNYNSGLMEISVNSQTNAGNYTAIVSLQDTIHYEWNDRTIADKLISWSIGKAAGSLSLDKTSISLNASNLTQTVTITRVGNGAISYSPNTVNGLTLSLSKNILTIKGNGSTAINNKIITISVAEGTNHTAPSSKTFTINAKYWEWGDETAVGDVTWWAGLKRALTNMTTTERANLVGKKKKVTLSTSVASWNSGANVSVICIGSDIDANKSLTFQTEGCSPEKIAFGSDALWASSNAKRKAEMFANNCSATDSMLSITKLTSSANNNNKDNIADVETTAKGFVPSEIEMGLGGTHSSSNLEGTKGRTVKAYPYYDSNNKRIKYTCSINGYITNSISWYWDRSRDCSLGQPYNVCAVDIDGSATANSQRTSYGCLAPAFVIG